MTPSNCCSSHFLCTLPPTLSTGVTLPVPVIVISTPPISEGIYGGIPHRRSGSIISCTVKRHQLPHSSRLVPVRIPSTSQSSASPHSIICRSCIEFYIKSTLPLPSPPLHSKCSRYFRQCGVNQLSCAKYKTTSGSGRRNSGSGTIFKYRQRARTHLKSCICCSCWWRKCVLILCLGTSSPSRNLQL